MALTREKKEQTVKEIASLLMGSKLTVAAKYAGTSVRSMQALKRSSKDAESVVRIAKNRLVKKAMASVDNFKNADTSALKGPLLYAFSDQDEMAPAKILADFAKTEPQIEFVGAFTNEGSFLAADEVKALAALPGKEQLRAHLASVLAAPMSGFVSVLANNLRGLANVLNARTEALNK